MVRTAFVLLLGAFGAAAQATLPLMPWPAEISTNAGAVAIDTTFTIGLSGVGAADPRVKAAALRAFARLSRQTGLLILPRMAAPDKATLRIAVEQRDHRGPQKPGDDEHYSLQAGDGSIRLSADAPLGVLRGLETFLQLVRQNGAGPDVGFSVPDVDIHDQPRFPWRGLSLDVSRHFIPVDGVKRTIDGLAAVKLNVFHWHLSDDQGFRVESLLYPRLQREGSDGMYYTQAEIRDVVAYARDRGVRVVPEFDVPGHSSSWLVAYPSLGAGRGPFTLVRQGDAPSGTMDPTKEATYRFLDNFFGEMVRLFPDPYFHIGGDEVDPHDWNADPRIRAFMKRQHLADAKALQAYFNRRLQKILARYGKRMVGWDEIFQADLPKSVVIQSWRGQKSLAETAHQGYAGILSAGYYLDLMQPAGQHYAVNPLGGDAAGLTDEEKKRILGGEAAMWEELAGAENLDAKLWPRLAAIAERFWSPEAVTDAASMYVRLAAVNHWLEWLGLTQRSGLRLMRRRLAGAMPVAPLDAFARLIEPVKGAERHRAGYGIFMPLNRLVDAIPPESDTAREFSNAVDRYLSERTPAGAAGLRQELTVWSQTVTDVRPMLQANSLLTEDLPIADGVAALCRAGMEALSYRSGAPADWKPRTLAAVKDASRHAAGLLIPFAPAIQKLVESVP